MVITEQNLVTKKEEEEVLKDLHNQDHTVVPGKMAIDQLHQAKPREALPEDTGDHIQEESLIDNTPEAVMKDQDLEKTTETSSHHIVKEDLQATPETVITAEISKEKTEVEEKEETLIGVPARKGTATEKETMTEEGRMKVKNRKAKRTNQDVTAADQRIT